MTTYVATFDEEKIGRVRGVQPFTFDIPDAEKYPHRLADAIAEKVFGYARRYLMSNGVDVVVNGEDLDGALTLHGDIFVGGFRLVGGFTVTEQEKP